VCVSKLCDDKWCVDKLCASGRRRRRREEAEGGGGIQNQKQEPHTKMWGKKNVAKTRHHQAHPSHPDALRRGAAVCQHWIPVTDLDDC